MLADPKDLPSRQVFMSGCYETPVTRLFRALVRPGDTVIDVGANAGYFSLLAAALVGGSGQVHSFEPSPLVADRLQHNILLNSCSHVTLHRVAVSDAQGSVQLHLSESTNTGMTSLRRLAGAHGKPVDVASIAIDSMISGMPRVRLVKIDVEGAEHLVLKGCRGLVRRDMPYIIFELTDSFLREMGSCATDLVAEVREMGYTTYVIRKESLQSMSEVPSEQCNVLACPAADERAAEFWSMANMSPRET